MLSSVEHEKKPQGLNFSNTTWISVVFLYCILIIFLSKLSIHLPIFCCFTFPLTAMVIAGWSVHLTTLFPGQA